MSIIALIEPTGLLGEELRELLDTRPDLWTEVLLRTLDEENAGVLTEVGGNAALVQLLEEGDLDRADVVVICGDVEDRSAALASLPASATTLLLTPSAEAQEGRVVVAGVNGESAMRGEVLVSPNANAVLLSQLLYPLLPFAPAAAAASLIQPVSGFGKEGLDELFDQTRALVAFAESSPTEVLGRRLAFNLFPATTPTPELAPLVSACLGREIPLSTQIVQGGIFHGISASLFVRLEDDPGPEAVREALGLHPAIALVDGEDEVPGPFESASSDQVLVGALEPDPAQKGGYRIWAAMDNLTVGGASNALGILVALLDPQAAH